VAKLLRWFPWRYVVSRVARARGLIDPIKVLSRLESFAQPLEVKEPLELLRAGMVFHARGLLNTSAIQHNLDWIWPYWVERQYDPHDVSFIPRAFSITHVNLTHRNWTAFGLPDVDQIPIVDPRGLVTPFWDGWSLDAWVLADDGRRLVPSRLLPADRVEQRLLCCDGGGVGTMAVVTTAGHEGLELVSRAEVICHEERAELLLTHEARADAPGWLVVALRPYNPEGVSFVHRLDLEEDRAGWTVDRKRRVRFDTPVERHRFSTYRDGDVFRRLPGAGSREAVDCNVGMASAAALFRIEPGAGAPSGFGEAAGARRVQVAMPLLSRAELRRWTPPFGKLAKRARAGGSGEAATWAKALEGHCRLETAHEPTRFLYDAAVRTLVLHAPGEDCYPGPYTYKRFWFRDAAFILHGLLCLGLFDRARRVLDSYPGRQSRDGFFLSQEGEWDSNGEALWILERSCRLSGRWLDEPWCHAVERGGRWITGKRVPDQKRNGNGEPHAGLLPAGFSAEHLGPNDYYYWDDFWGVAGLRAAASLLEHMGRDEPADRFRAEADDLLAAIDRSVAHAVERLGTPAIPASPYRRLDSGAIGSVAASYPLALWAADDPRMLGTLDYLVRDCLVDGGFFQDVIHSGINPYLTLHLAQALLRAGDPLRLDQARGLMRAVARLASPTGQWPEAIHPRTGGGCMGDGHHVWAAAEWVLAVRNALVREEADGAGERLVLASGVMPEWLDAGELSFGPAPTPWGPITVRVARRGAAVEVSWQGRWRGEPPPVEVRVPGAQPHQAPAALVASDGGAGSGGSVTVALRTRAAPPAAAGDPVRVS